MFRKDFMRLLLLAFYFRSFNASPLIGKAIKPVKDGEFPFIVSLSVNFKQRKLREKYQFCGGSLITETHILTAAHCLKTEIVKKMVVVVGNNRVALGDRFKIRSWITYDEWAEENNVVPLYSDNDIAIVTLKDKVTNVKPGIISKLTHDEVIGRDVVTAGWGYINETVITIPPSLQKATFKVLSLEEYQVIRAKLPLSKRVIALPNNYYTISKRRIILGCGDSGGPLLLKGNKEIVGVNDSTCDIKEPGKFLNVPSFHMVVDYYRDFINNVTNSTIA